jgi:hypothetical protein
MPRLDSARSARAPLAVPHSVDDAVDAAGLPIPVPDRPDALAGLSIVIACRDDERTVARAVAHAAWAAARTSLDYEIVVVDDGSSDATLEVIAGFARPGGRLRVLLHARSRGSGAAVRTGIAVSSMPWVLLIDATDELDLDGLEDFLPLASRHDLLIGWRVMRRGPAAKRAKGGVWNWLVRRVLDISVRDVDCPLKLVRRDLLERLELTLPGPMFAAELMAEAHVLDARVAEVNVRQRAEVVAPGKSGASPAPSARRLVCLARLRRRMPGGQNPWPGHKALGLGVAALAVVAGVGWLYLIRGSGLLGAGPRLQGALPLQQLAGDDGQPLLRMAAAWLPAGAVAGLTLRRVGRVRRPVLVTAGVGVALLALTGAASDAVAAGSLSLTSSRLLPQLGHPGVLAALVLLAIGAALAAELPRRPKT